MKQKPKTYFVAGIIGLFLFLPTALLALVFSTQVNSFWDDNNTIMAQRYSQWALVSIIATYAISIIVILFLLSIWIFDTGIDKHWNIGRP